MIGQRRISGEFLEQFPETALIVKSALLHDILNRSSGNFQKLPGGLQADPGQKAKDGTARFLTEKMQKARFAQTSLRSQILNPDFLCKPFFDEFHGMPDPDIGNLFPKFPFSQNTVPAFTEDHRKIRQKFLNLREFLLFDPFHSKNLSGLAEKNPGKKYLRTAFALEKRNHQLGNTSMTGADKRASLLLRAPGQKEIVIDRTEA